VSTRIYDLNVAVRLDPYGRTLTLRIGNDAVASVTDDGEPTLAEATRELLKEAAK